MRAIGIGIPFYRASGGGAPSNTPRTQAFLTATGITDATIISALNAMDNSLISAGLLPAGTGSGKFKALYPNVGGTASAHKFNFVNPLDTDAAFRVVFNGGWTHTANGAISNGTNAFADTFINALNDYSVNTITWGSYRVQTAANVQIGLADLSTYERSIANSIGIYAAFTISPRTFDTNGMVQMSRIDNSSLKINSNGVVNINSQAFVSRANQKFNYGGTASGFFSAGTWKMVYFADLLSDSEQTAFSSINSTFQTSLGRL